MYFISALTRPLYRSEGTNKNNWRYLNVASVLVYIGCVVVLIVSAILYGQTTQHRVSLGSYRPEDDNLALTEVSFKAPTLQLDSTTTVVTTFTIFFARNKTTCKNLLSSYDYFCSGNHIIEQTREGNRLSWMLGIPRLNVNWTFTPVPNECSALPDPGFSSNCEGAWYVVACDGTVVETMRRCQGIREEFTASPAQLSAIAPCADFLLQSTPARLPKTAESSCQAWVDYYDQTFKFVSSYEIHPTAYQVAAASLQNFYSSISAFISIVTLLHSFWKPPLTDAEKHQLEAEKSKPFLHRRNPLTPSCVNLVRSGEYPKRYINLGLGIVIICIITLIVSVIVYQTRPNNVTTIGDYDPKLSNAAFRPWRTDAGTPAGVDGITYWALDMKLLDYKDCTRALVSKASCPAMTKIYYFGRLEISIRPNNYIASSLTKYYPLEVESTTCFNDLVPFCKTGVFTADVTCNNTGRNIILCEEEITDPGIKNQFLSCLDSVDPIAVPEICSAFINASQFAHDEPQSTPLFEGLAYGFSLTLMVYTVLFGILAFFRDLWYDKKTNQESSSSLDDRRVLTIDRTIDNQIGENDYFFLNVGGYIVLGSAILCAVLCGIAYSQVSLKSIDLGKYIPDANNVALELQVQYTNSSPGGFRWDGNVRDMSLTTCQNLFQSFGADSSCISSLYFYTTSAPIIDMLVYHDYKVLVSWRYNKPVECQGCTNTYLDTNGGELCGWREWIRSSSTCTNKELCITAIEQLQPDPVKVNNICTETLNNADIIFQRTYEEPPSNEMIFSVSMAFFSFVQFVGLIVLEALHNNGRKRGDGKEGGEGGGVEINSLKGGTETTG